MIRLAHVTKSFGAMRAVDDASFAIDAGEIVAVVGENGAGKTTLMRIAAGELAADSGSVDRRGHAGLVHQHFMLVGELSIAENLALTGRDRLRFATRATLEREAARVIEEIGIDLRDVSRRADELSVGEKAKLELIKAISRKPSTLILDEPTSVLTPREAEELFRVMRSLAATGTAVVFISHKLPEVLSIADRTVVMRRGRVVPTTASTPEELAHAMVGTLERRLPAGRTAGIRSTALSTGQPALVDRDLVVHQSEIVAVVGVAGNGQTELAARLRDRLANSGHIPEDRTRNGIVAEMTIAENLALRAKRWNPRAANAHAQRMIELYSIGASGPTQRAGDLSGGNQQKVILARELAGKPSVIVAAEPTRGLDIEATQYVHDQLRSAAAEGAAILLITSDLDEAFGLADLVQVIYRGKLSERMAPADAQTRIAALMAGIA